MASPSAAGAKTEQAFFLYLFIHLKKRNMKSKFKIVLLAVSTAFMATIGMAKTGTEEEVIWDDTLNCGAPCEAHPSNICCQKREVSGTDQNPVIKIRKRKGILEAQGF
jgi:hypothetical protein